MAMTLSTVPWLSSGVVAGGARTPLASLSLLTGRRPTTTITFNGVTAPSVPLLNSSFLAPSSSLSSTFSGLSLGLDFAPNRAKTGRSHRLVVRAGKKYQLCQTKRSRSRKSLARTHGFRYRMSTTSGRAVLKRRRAKGRAILCTKTNPSSGKRVSD